MVLTKLSDVVLMIEMNENGWIEVIWQKLQQWHATPSLEQVFGFRGEYGRKAET
jgi:hypothetical protein